jgi:EmrB/QacA subfamily drug resistance transporter
MKDRLDPALVRLAAVLMTGVMAVVFDTTIVNVALDTLGRDLRAPVATIQWVTTGYLLALGIAVPVTGWLLSRLGGKRLWMISQVVFLLGSLGSSLSWNASSLIGFRVVQGIGGGLMLPVMMTLIVQAANGRSLGSVTSFISMPVLLGPVLGPLIGGLIVSDLSWRWIFWINVPFGLASLALAWRLMPSGKPATAPKLDALGLLLLSPGLAATIFGLSKVGAEGGFGHADVLVPLIGGVGLIAAFTIRALRMHGEALVDVRLFRVSTLSVSTALQFLSGFVLYGAMLLLPLYFQQVRGQDALHAGLLLVPQGIGVLLSRSLAGRLTDRIGPRWVAFVGLLVVALGTIPFTHVGTGTNEWLIAAALVVRGIGLGAVTIPITASAYSGLARSDVPHASIITRTAQQIGGSFGTAILAVILQTEVTAHGGASLAAKTAAFDATFWWAVGFTVAAVLLTLALPSAGKIATPSEPTAEPPANPTPAQVTASA